MMHVRFVALPLVMLLVLGGCSGRLSEADKKAIADAAIVIEHIEKEAEEKGTPNVIYFEAGAFMGGTAVISQHGMAFWVTDGKGYAVNELARKAAPDLPQAPAHIQYDDAFKTAAREGV